MEEKEIMGYVREMAKRLFQDDFHFANVFECILDDMGVSEDMEIRDAIVGKFQEIVMEALDGKR